MQNDALEKRLEIMKESAKRLRDNKHEDKSSEVEALQEVIKVSVFDSK